MFTPVYRGRFAPSPTGPLHLGSLVSALASYLDARAHKGTWLVRIEDIDPPREMTGAVDLILRCLEAHGLHWDESVIYQSQRHSAYEETLQQLREKGLIYPCSCTRQDLASMGRIYNGHCRHHPPVSGTPSALRVMLTNSISSSPESAPITRFNDLFQGQQTHNLVEDGGDPILKRKDGLYAYPLAVVVDDAAQGITHIIRGMDLLEVTARQVFLFELLGFKTPIYGHVPLITFADGLKLSKQNRAPALVNEKASQNLWQALDFLGQNPPYELLHAPVNTLIEWGVANWDRNKVRGQTRIYTESTALTANEPTP